MSKVPDPGPRDLVPLNSHELGEVRAAVRAPRAMQVIESRDDRVIVSPYPLRQTFKAVASALRTRLYHGTTPASPPVEDLPSGTLRGRRAFLEGTPSATRLLMGVPLVGPVLANWILDVEVRVTERQGQVLVGFRLRTTLPQSIGQNVTSKEFEGLISDFQRLLPTISLGPEVVPDPIIGPGEPTPEAFSGTLRDYSRCAKLDDLRQLREGDFPLGRYLWPSLDAHGSAALFLGAPHDDRGHALEHLMFRNVCVTAPVGMGKSYSIFRPWAVSAARAGFSTLVFDPKGDLTQDLREPVFAAGNRVVIFSTSPEQPSVNWNFMDEVEIDQQGRLKSRRAIEAILDALLPRESSNSESEKEEFASRLFRGWLGGFIQIAKYALGDEADAFVLYQMARDDNRLKELLQTVLERWGPTIHERLYYEVNDLFDKFEWGYTAQLRGVANALAPFVQDPLRNRTRARAGQRRFRITDLFRARCATSRRRNALARWPRRFCCRISTNVVRPPPGSPTRAFRSCCCSMKHGC
jgi:type IV secretory system conjugative DNA transfer VirD4/TraG family protein